MRVFALSDVHVDYPTNRKRLDGLSPADYRDDVLILAGDMTDNLALLAQRLLELAAKFSRVLFVPGNHELWVIRDTLSGSIEKFDAVLEIAEACGVSMEPVHFGTLSVVHGHSHVQRRVDLDAVCYVNNAFGYPSETRIPNKDLLCTHEQ